PSNGCATGSCRIPPRIDLVDSRSNIVGNVGSRHAAPHVHADQRIRFALEKRVDSRTVPARGVHVARPRDRHNTPRPAEPRRTETTYAAMSSALASATQAISERLR